jgi:cell wall-associated NlpC family hydrolase
MNQTSPQDGYARGDTSTPRTRTNENYLDTLHVRSVGRSPNQSTHNSSQNPWGKSVAGRSPQFVLARSHHEKTSPNRLQRKLPHGITHIQRILSIAQVAASKSSQKSAQKSAQKPTLFNNTWSNTPLERLKREMGRLEVVKRPKLLLAGIFGLGLSTVALADSQYQIQSGDSLWVIARANNLTVDQLKTANNLTDDTILIGEKLIIPSSSAVRQETQATQQARAAQKVVLLNRLNDLKVQRETRQQAQGVSSDTRSNLEVLTSAIGSTFNSAAEVVLKSAQEAASKSKSPLAENIVLQATAQATAQASAQLPEQTQEQQARAVEKQKLLGRMNQMLSQDRRAVQTSQTNPLEQKEPNSTSPSVGAQGVPVQTGPVQTPLETPENNTPENNTPDAVPTHPNNQTTAIDSINQRLSDIQARAAERVARIKRLADERATKKADLLARLEQQKQERLTQQVARNQAREDARVQRAKEIRQARLERNNRNSEANTGSSAGRGRVHAAASRYVGIRYRLGATGRGGIDCSAFTQATLRDMGYRVPRTSRAQSGVGSRVSFRNLRSGDLVFFNTLGRGVSHVGIYIGNGQFANANSYRGRVVVESIHSRYWTSRFVTARRVIG